MAHAWAESSAHGAGVEEGISYENSELRRLTRSGACGVWGVVLLHRRKSKPGTLTALVRLARASSAAAVTAVAVPDSPPTLAPACGGGRVAAMKQILLMIAMVALVGCGGEDATEEMAPVLDGDPVVEKAIRGELKKPTPAGPNGQKPVREEDVLGTYEGIEKVSPDGTKNKMFVGLKFTFLDNNVCVVYRYGLKKGEVKWEIIDNEIITNGVEIYRVEPNGDLTIIGYFKNGKRSDSPSWMHARFKKLRE